VSAEIRDANGVLLEIGAVVRYRRRNRPHGPGRRWGWTEDLRSDLRLTAVKGNGWCRGVYVEPRHAPDGIPAGFEWALSPEQIEEGYYVVVSPAPASVETRKEGR
jgi:hypothetical protein